MVAMRIIRAATAGLLIVQLASPELIAQQAMTPDPSTMNGNDGMTPQNREKLPLPSLTPQDTDSQPATAPQLNLPQSAALMNDDQVVLHLLNRFTYGPRPGDVERVQKMGMVPWLRQQLQPETIDDSALDKRLAAYPAMRLPLGELMKRYPNAQMIRQIAGGKGSIPGGAAEHAIYTRQMERYRKNKNKKAGKANDSMKDTESTFDAEAMLSDAPKSRFNFLCSLSASEFRDMQDALTQDQRVRLFDGFTPQQREVIAALNNPRQVVTSEVVQTKILRDIYSERQLQEIMTDFWLNHFNVYMAKSQEAPYYIAEYERNVIRPHALGYFEELLVATAASPAMLNYLDNAESIGPHSVAAEQAGRQKKKGAGLNENYAREVMELHTVGVNGGYSQHDVTDLAKVFTGWTIDRRNGKDSQAGFDAEKHEGGAKVVMDVRVKPNGEKEGVQMLHMLATNPHTAHFVCQKIAVRFVSDDPPPALVDRMSAEFLRTKGNIRAILAAMIASPEFWSSSDYHAKMKTPQDYVVSAIRASGAQVYSPSTLDNALVQLGMPLYGHQTPDGYSMKAEAWNSTAALIGRLNFAFALAANRIPGVYTDWDAMLGANASTMTSEQKETTLEKDLLHLPASPHTRQTILKTISGDNAQDNAMLRQLVTKYLKKDLITFAQPSTQAAPLDPQAALAAGFLIGSPEFQRR